MKINTSARLNANELKRNHYLTRCASNKEVVLLTAYRSSNQDVLLNGNVHQCRTWDSAQNYYRQNYGDSYYPFFLMREDFNNLFDNRFETTVEELLAMNERCATQKGKSMQSLPGQKNKPVYLVWNASLCALAGAVATEDQAIQLAQDKARENPTHIFFINPPMKKVFQPINITVEAVEVEIPEAAAE